MPTHSIPDCSFPSTCLYYAVQGSMPSLDIPCLHGQLACNAICIGLQTVQEAVYMSDMPLAKGSCPVSVCMQIICHAITLKSLAVPLRVTTSTKAVPSLQSAPSADQLISCQQ